MYKLLIIILLLTPLTTWSGVWHKANGPYEYASSYNIFIMNDALYCSESHSKKIYKYFDGQWNRLDTGIFADKGIVLYLAQKGDIIFASTQNGLCTSYDSGRHWKVYDALGGETDYKSATIVDSTIFLQAYYPNTLRRLRKGTDTLEKIYIDGTQDSIFIEAIITVGDYIFAAGPNEQSNIVNQIGNFYISSDKGKTWVLSESMGKRIAHLLYHNNILFAFMADNGLYKSTDFGQTWIADTSVNLSVKKVVSYKDLIFACNEKIYISSDDGKTWQVSKDNGLSSQGCKEILTNKDTMYYLNTRQMVYFSTNEGKYWNANPLTNSDVSERYIVRSQDTLFATGSYTVHYSVDEGMSWQIYSDSLHYLYSRWSIVQKKDSIIIVIGQLLFSAYISTDYGKSWEYLDFFDGVSFMDPWINDVLIMSNRMLLFSSKKGTLYTDDFGQSWKKYDDNVFKSDYEVYYHYRSSENDIIVLTEAGKLITNDNGLTWQLDEYDESIRKTCYNKVGEDLYSIDAKNKIYKSTDWGKTWEDLHSEFKPANYITDFIVYNDYFIALYENKAMVSGDWGKTWEAFEANITLPAEKPLYLNSAIVDGDYLIVTSNNGIWRAKLSDLGISKSSVEPSNSPRLKLMTTYPNPASGKVRITFTAETINHLDDMVLYLVNMSNGKKVEIKDYKIAWTGSQGGELTFDTSDFQPGAYLISFSADGCDGYDGYAKLMINR